MGPSGVMATAIIAVASGWTYHAITVADDAVHKLAVGDAVPGGQKYPSLHGSTVALEEPAGQAYPAAQTYRNGDGVVEAGTGQK